MNRNATGTEFVNAQLLDLRELIDDYAKRIKNTIRVYFADQYKGYPANAFYPTNGADVSGNISPVYCVIGEGYDDGRNGIILFSENQFYSGPSQGTSAMYSVATYFGRWYGRSVPILTADYVTYSLPLLSSDKMEIVSNKVINGGDFILPDEN